MYKYETHLHSSPVSKCGSFSVRENMEFYRDIGYDGIFLTNHFLDANIGGDRTRPYEEQIEFFFSDIEEGERIADEVGIKFFWGVETSYLGTDFLVYGLSKEWYLAHPEIMEMKKSEELSFLMDSGALVIHAHPYREDSYIDHIRLFPRCVHGVEVVNACRKDFVNEMAEKYADAYALLKIAGTDNHSPAKLKRISGLEFSSPIESELDFCKRVFAGEGEIFTISLEGSDNDE